MILRVAMCNVMCYSKNYKGVTIYGRRLAFSRETGLSVYIEISWETVGNLC